MRKECCRTIGGGEITLERVLCKDAPSVSVDRRPRGDVASGVNSRPCPAGTTGDVGTDSLLMVALETVIRVIRCDLGDDGSFRSGFEMIGLSCAGRLPTVKGEGDEGKVVVCARGLPGDLGSNAPPSPC